MNLPGLSVCQKEISLMDEWGPIEEIEEDERGPMIWVNDKRIQDFEEGIMEKPAYAAVESIVKKEDAIESAFSNLKKELSLAVKEHVAVIETKLKSALAENERLHHERLILAKEIQRRRSQEKNILEILGGKDGSKG